MHFNQKVHDIIDSMRFVVNWESLPVAPSGVVLAHLESSLDSGLLECMTGKLPGELVLLCWCYWWERVV